MARDEAELQEAKRIIRESYPNASVLIIKCDSSDRHQVDDAVLMTMHIYGRLDAVINNAGVIAVSPYDNTTSRAELMKDNIYVTAVSPGLMRTGSLGHAEFKGQVQKEYSCFSLGSSLPILTIGAERAADKILSASRLGLAEAALSAEFFADAMDLTNSLLPNANNNKSNVKGQYTHSSTSPSLLTKLSERAAIRNNEKSI